MKNVKSYTIGAIFALGLSNAAWAQQQDLEVTMDVLPANASANAATGEIKLPDTASQAQDASAFGLETANRAHELKGDLGRAFGEEVSDRAREHAPNIPPASSRP
ncbi:MAG TPA: hypothetical protein VGR01_17700 [Burkholderiales bacterium]|jgi:hypothetical protein|nr:hypothetical protein [Burkholderiales bacterium]